MIVSSSTSPHYCFVPDLDFYNLLCRCYVWVLWSKVYLVDRIVLSLCTMTV